MKFLKAIGIERTNIIAHSFGGRIAIWFAANYPEKINKLILINSAGIKPGRTLKYHIKVAIAKTGKKLFTLSIFGKYRERLLNNLYRLVGSKDYQQQTGIMRSTLVKVINEDLRGLLPKIIAPTLLIWGENDKDVPLSSAKIMESKIKDAGLVVFKDAGHFSYLDKFSDFCVIVTKFLGSTRVLKHMVDILHYIINAAVTALLVIAILRAIPFLHMLQLEGYKNKRFIKWLVTNPAKILIVRPIKEPKKKLVFTARATRLFVLTLFLLAFVAYYFFTLSPLFL